MHGKLSENTGCLRPITRQLLAGIAFNDNTVGIEIVFAVAHAAPCQTDTCHRERLTSHRNSIGIKTVGTLFVVSIKLGGDV